jgi:hypothetical protein
MVVMNDFQKILQMLEALQDDVAGIKTAVTALQSDVTTIKDVQQQEGKRLTALEAGQIALDLKVEAVHAYQQQAHTEIMGHVIDTSDLSEHDHKALVKRVERIEKHLDLPPGK